MFLLCRVERNAGTRGKEAAFDMGDFKVVVDWVVSICDYRWIFTGDGLESLGQWLGHRR